MSLDVYLYESKKCPECGHCVETNELLFEANITHNLGGMAKEAGIYKALWHPDEIDAKHAKDIVHLLESGLAKLKYDPSYFKTFNASNGWGKYKNFVPWVEKYLLACKEDPSAFIYVSR